MAIQIGDRSLLCIDWDERSLRVIEASVTRAKVRIRRAVHAPLTAGTIVRDPASMGNFLKQTLREHRIRSRRAVVDIPRQDAVMNLALMPPGSTDELAAMIHIQAGKDLPFSKDQAVIDFAITDRNSGGQYELWIAAVRNHVVDYYKQVIEEAGLQLERIGLRPSATCVGVAAGGEVNGRTVTVDIGPSMTEINVLRDGRLVYSRAASVSVQAEKPQVEESPELPAGPAVDLTIPLADDFLPKPGPLDGLLIEVSRTIQAYRATDAGARIDRIILSGTAGVDERGCSAFQARFSAPTQVYAPPASLDWAHVTEMSAAPFTTVIGLALSDTSDVSEQFNLLRPKEPEAGRRERVRRIPVMVALVAVLLLTVGALGYQKIHAKSAQVAALVSRRMDLDSDKKVREAFMKQAKELDTWLNENVIWLDRIRLIAEALPSNQEGYVTQLECDENGRVTIELDTKNTRVATKLAEDLRAIKAEVSDGKGGSRNMSLFEADVQDPKLSPKGGEYPWSDTVIVRLKTTGALVTSRPAESAPAVATSRPVRK